MKNTLTRGITFLAGGVSKQARGIRTVTRGVSI